MTARELYQAGKLDEAVQALDAELRNNPEDIKRRTFLFELLCFAGNFDRAEKQLDILSQGSPDAMTGAMLYRAALHAERTRREMFEKKDFPLTGPSLHEPGGILNGKPFDSLTDSDPRIGPRLEVYAAGQYMWIPFEHIASLEMQPPKRLRDLLWAPVVLRTGPTFLGVGGTGRGRNTVRPEDFPGGRRGLPDPGTAATGVRGSRRYPARPCLCAM